MILVGIDPGKTTGWCAYDTDLQRVVDAGEQPDHVLDVAQLAAIHEPEAWVVESFTTVRAGIYPETVTAAYTAGRLVERLELSGHIVHELSRLDVKRRLTDAALGEIRVKNDATAWQALMLLHGDNAHRKGGALHGLKAKGGHQRAALAVLYAWWLGGRRQ